MSNAAFQIDPAASPTLATTAVVPVLNGAVTNQTGVGPSAAGLTTLSALATFLAANTSGPLVVTSASATAVAVGPNGTTNPVLKIDASTASQAAGLSLTGATASGSVALAVISSGSAAALLIDAKGIGTIGIGTVSTGAITLGTTTTINGQLNVSTTVLTSSSATALVVGPNGGTNPVLKVDASTASQAAGLSLTGAATGGTVALACIDSGAAANLTVDAKGSGTVKIGSVSTGAITLGTSAGTNGVVIDGTAYGAGVASLRLNGLTSAAGANVGTLTNCPHSGNPSFWCPISIAGTVYAFPCYALT